MKLFTKAILLFSPVVMNAQNQPVQFDTIVILKGTKAELFSKAKSWIVKNFNSPKDVIQSEDKEKGVIISRGKLPYEYVYYTVKKKEIEVFASDCLNSMKFSFGIYLKDDKAKIVFFDIVIAAMRELREYEHGLDSAKYKQYENLSKSANLEEKAIGMSGLSGLTSIEKSLKELMRSIVVYLAAKAENDF